MSRALITAILLASTALSACASMAPAYEKPALPVAQATLRRAWPGFGFDCHCRIHYLRGS